MQRHLSKAIVAFTEAFIARRQSAAPTPCPAHCVASLTRMRLKLRQWTETRSKRLTLVFAFGQVAEPEHGEAADHAVAVEQGEARKRLSRGRRRAGCSQGK